MVTDTYICDNGHEFDRDDMAGIVVRNRCPLCGEFMMTIETKYKNESMEREGYDKQKE